MEDNLDVNYCINEHNELFIYIGKYLYCTIQDVKSDKDAELLILDEMDNIKEAINKLKTKGENKNGRN